MLVLGIDPGTATTGYGLVREHDDGTLQAIAFGVITTPARTPMADRLRQLYHDVSALIAEHRTPPPSKRSTSARTSPRRSPWRKGAA